MRLIDADKFLEYLIFSKYIDNLKCKEVKEAVEMCKVDVLDKIRDEIEEGLTDYIIGEQDISTAKKMFKVMDKALDIIDRYTKENRNERT